MQDIKWIIVYGNPIEGFTYRGPFNTSDEVIRYADAAGECEWWLAELAPAND